MYVLAPPSDTNPPNHVRRWMQGHISVIGDLPLSEICIPASRNAGMYVRFSETPGGADDNDLFQTMSIYDQLRFGARMLDIRPTYHYGGWFCGHYTHTGAAFGWGEWKGGDGASIEKVIEEINLFTSRNSELIIVNISLVFNMDEGRKCNNAERDQLLNLLSNLNYLYTARNPMDIRLDRMRLREYIDGNQPCVLVVFADDAYLDLSPDHPASRNFFHKQTRLPINERHICPKRDGEVQEPDPGFGSSLGSTSASVLTMNDTFVQTEFPVVLQDITSDYPSTIVIDNVRNVDAITLSLATTYYRHYFSNGVTDPVIVYGGHLITSTEVFSRIATAIHNQEDYTVSNESLGGDPLYLVYKSCAVFYYDYGLVKGRFAWEGKALTFSQDVYRIIYGGVELTKQAVYNRAYRALVTQSSFQVVGNQLGGTPPAENATCTIEYSTSFSLRKRRTVLVGEVIDFSQDILSIEYGGHTITDPAVFEKIFLAMQRGRGYFVSKENFGVGATPTAQRSCRIWYRSKSTHIVLEADEGKVLTFEDISSRQGFVRKTYSIEYGGQAVTDPVVFRRLFLAIRSGTGFPVQDEFLGVSPQNVLKTCKVTYEGKVVQAMEGDVMLFEEGPRPETLDQDVFSVEYGGRSVNPAVRRAVLSAIRSKSKYPVSNDSMGGDPMFGVRKMCRVTYYGQVTQAEEGDVLEFDCYPEVSWNITSIEYGGHTIANSDVFKKLTSAMREKKGFLVNSATLGGDPRPGMRKTCRVSYQSKLKKIVKGGEGSTLWFEGAPTRPDESVQEIISVEYGGRMISNPIVYKRVLWAMQTRAGFFVSNDNLGGDPMYGVRKTCRITYQISSNKVVQADEGEILRFDERSLGSGQVMDVSQDISSIDRGAAMDLVQSPPQAYSSEPPAYHSLFPG